MRLFIHDYFYARTIWYFLYHSGNIYMAASVQLRNVKVSTDNIDFTTLFILINR